MSTSDAKPVIQIDGAQGEGGGQIIRSSLALSAITGKPFRVTNIRAGRKKPGLKNQHVLAVRAAQRVCNATCEGDSLGSSSLIFYPNPICAGHYEFKMGTAGSTCLVAQTVLPALMMADQPSKLVLEGGTHNPFAPPFDFLQRSYLPQIAKMGPQVKAELIRPGFYPGGGGRFELQIQPCEHLKGLNLIERGKEESQQVLAFVSALPAHIGEREISTICRKAGWRKSSGRVIQVEEPRGPGNVVLVELTYEHVTAIFTAFGERGVTAERVASKVWRETKKFVEANVPVEEYLADQLMLPMGLAAAQGQSSSFRTQELSGHSVTHLEILRQFLEIQTPVNQQSDGSWVVEFHPID